MPAWLSHKSVRSSVTQEDFEFVWIPPEDFLAVQEETQGRPRSQHAPAGLETPLQQGTRRWQLACLVSPIRTTILPWIGGKPMDGLMEDWI